MPWDPATYHKFQAERFAPFNDLLRLIVMPPGRRIIDLGCGTGELTALLADALEPREIVGLDSSAEMLEQARLIDGPGLRFEQGTIEAGAGSWDLVFSHAAIQWVDDHRGLIPRLFALVAPGGQRAVQLPSNHNHPTHTLIRETAGEEPYCPALGGWTRTAPVLEIDEYASMLFDLGAQSIVAFEKVYAHVLEDASGMVVGVRHGADSVHGTAAGITARAVPRTLRVEGRRGIPRLPRLLSVPPHIVRRSPSGVGASPKRYATLQCPRPKTPVGRRTTC